MSECKKCGDKYPVLDYRCGSCLGCSGCCECVSPTQMMGLGAESFGAEKKNCGCGQDPCVTYGAESLMAINQNTPISNFTTNELTHSSTVQGDFNQASINSSGHQNFEVRGAEDIDGRVVNIVGVEDKVYVTIRFPDSDKIFVGDMEGSLQAKS